MKKIVPLIALMAILAACSGLQETPTTSQLEENSSYFKNGWKLPLDDYLHGYDLTTDLAIIAKYRDCTGEVQDSNSDVSRFTNHGEAFGPTGRRLFNIKVAQSIGYSLGRAPEPIMISTVKSNEEVTNENTGCWPQALAAVPPFPEVPIGWLLSGEASTIAFADQNVIDAIVEWKNCISKDYPEYETLTPDKMPGKNVDTPIYYVPDQTEIDLAVADAQCRVTSQYNQSLYLAETEAQLDLISEKIEEIKSDDAQFRAVQEWTKSVLDK